MRIRESNKWKIALRTYYGYIKYQVILFNLTNVPVIFQDYINKLLVKELDIFVIVYLDNIFIYTKNKREGHVKVIW